MLKKKRIGCYIFRTQELAQTYWRSHPEVAAKLDPDDNDNQDPNKEIRATFMYYQLIDIKGTGFDIK